MRIVFMGTPEFAVPCLTELLKAHEVLAVVTRPDAQRDRGQRIKFSPVKEAALAARLPVLQPEGGLAESLLAYDADAFVVVAFGRILPESVLRMPKKYGCINVHGSLLPKLRGAAPIHWAVVNGEKKTGITVMRMDRGLDTGDMLHKAELPIAPDDTAGSLHDKLSLLGAQALSEALEMLEHDTANAEPQNHAEATYAPMLTKEHGHIDWHLPAQSVVNLIRGFNPWPGAYALYNSEPLKIWRAKTADKSGVPGRISDITKEGIIVGAGDGSVIITELQARGARRMPAADYLRGHRVEKDTVLD